jgi:serine/threonine-protein kinase
VTEKATVFVGSGKPRFRILDRLGHGGCAEVFLAVSEGAAGFSKLVVLKEPRPEFLERVDGREMFLTEARVAARLNHPNVVQTLEVIDAEPPRIVMEYLEGQTLLALAKKAGPALTLELSCRILADALLGLHHAHNLTDYDGKGLGLVHRDANPNNIFITFEGQVKLLDFGIAKMEQTSVHTEAGVIKGKIRYMPPEQFMGEGIDRRTDIFAIGVVLWEAMTGKRMWAGMPDYAVMKALLDGDIAEPRSLKPDVPDELNRICMRALAADKSQRYDTAELMSADLEAYLDTTARRATSRDLARLVSTTFAEEREANKRRIDHQLGEVGSFSADYKTLRRALHDGAASAVRDLRGASDDPPSGGSHLRETRVEPRRPPGDGRRGKLAIGVGVGVLVILLGGAVRWATSRSGANSPVAAVAATAAAATAVASTATPAASEQPVAPAASTVTRNDEAPKEVHVAISVTPANAQLFLDGNRVATTPLITTLPAGTKVHRVRAVAQGFVPAQAEFVPNKDIDLSLTLVHARGAGPAPRPVAAATPSDATQAKPGPTEPAPTPGLVNEP